MKDYGEKVSKEWLAAHKHYTAALLISYGGIALNAMIEWFYFGRNGASMPIVAVIFAAFAIWTLNDKRRKSRDRIAVIGAVFALLCVTLYFFVYRDGCYILTLPLAAECSVMLAYAIVFKNFEQ